MRWPWSKKTVDLAEPPPALLGEIASAVADQTMLELYGAQSLAKSRDEILRLHGCGDLNLYERLRTDDQVYSTFGQRRAAVVSRPYHVDPGGPSALDIQAADYLRAQVQRIPFDALTMRMLNGVFYGHSVGECMYDIAAGKVELQTIKVRRARRFAFSTGGDLVLRRPTGTERMPERKFWVFISGSEDDDDFYGIGLGHYLYWPVFLKRNSIKAWALWQEKFASPTPVAKGPSGMIDAEESKLLGLLKAITNGGRIVIPKHIEIELLQVLHDSGESYERFVKLLNAAISKITLGQTMTTDDGSSRSQAQVHYQVLDFIARTESDLLTESFSSGPGRWLTEWNFPGAAIPVVWRNFETAEDLQARAERDVAIRQLGYRPTPQYIQETYGEGFELEPVASPAFAEPIPDTAQSVEDLIQDDGWRRVLGPEVERIEKLVADTASLEEVRDRLGEFAQGSPDELTDALARVMFSARVAGVLDAEETDSGDG